MPTALDEIAHAARLVHQHAMTARLMGVDVVPRYRAASAIDEAMPAATELTASPAPGPGPALFASVEVKPAPPRTPASNPASTPSIAARPDPLDGFTRPAREANEDERAYRTRCLAALQARYEADAPHQHFVTAHTTIVFHDGDPCARLAFVGEAPGEEEDKTGTPFVGRAGQLLNKMIAAMGLTREDVYICNVLKTRPPGNATPTSREAALCEPYLLEQLAIVRPEVIVTLGLPATKILLKTEESMARLRGRWSQLRLADASTIPVMPTYHPAFLLRSYTPDNRAKVWADLKLALDKLGLTPPKGT